MGLNYTIPANNVLPEDIKEIIKDFLRNNYFISKYLRLNKISFYSKDFEFYPIPHKNNNILFIARLWNPDDVSLDS